MEQEIWVEDVVFRVGPYGEIFPLPLVSGVSPDEAIQQLVSYSESLGQEVDVPSRGHAREGLINLAMTFVHQRNLRLALDGEMDDVPEARALRIAVVEDRRPMSLRPLGLEFLTFMTFAPVFQAVPSGKWRVGLREHGLVKDFDAASPGQALGMAQAIYVRWSEQDEDKWRDAIKKRVGEPSVDHLIAQAQLVSRGSVSAGKWTLTRLGRHGTYLLHGEKGDRVLSASTPERAIGILSAVAGRVVKRPVTPDEVVDALRIMGAPSLPLTGAVGEVIEVNDTKVKILGTSDTLLAVLTRKGERFVVKRTGRRLTLLKVNERRKGQFVQASQLLVPDHWDDGATLLVAASWGVWKSLLL